MQEKSELNLWRPYDDNGKSLFTQIPNSVLRLITVGGYKPSENQILAYLSRMTFGFHREETNQLGLKDFTDALGMSGPQVSTAIKSMLADGAIFRHSKNGNKYVYAVNTLRLGMTMKHYRIGKVDEKIDNGVYENEKIDYELRNYTNVKNYIILYSKVGYEKSKVSYIKDDINSDIKEDKGQAKSLSSPPVGRTATKPPTDKEINSIYASFHEELKSKYNIETLLKYMSKLNQLGVPYVDIGIPYYEYCVKVGNDCYKRSSKERNLFIEASEIFAKNR